jgi:hypothetical protein
MSSAPSPARHRLLRPLFRLGTLVSLAPFVLTLLLLPQDVRAAVDPPGEVRLSLERYERLMARAGAGDGPRATFTRGQVRVTLPSDAEATVRVAIQTELSIHGDGLAEVPLLPAELVLEDVRLAGAAGSLSHRAGAHVLLVPAGTRQAALQLNYLAPVQRDDAGGRVALVALPPLPSSTFTVMGGGPAVELWPASDLRRAGGTTTGSVPVTAAAVVRWGREHADFRVVSSDYRVVINERIDAADVEATFAVTMTAPTALLPIARDTVALMEVRGRGGALPLLVGDGLHRARLNGTGEHEVVARFRVPIDRSQGQPRVLVPLGAAPILRVRADVPGEREVTFDPPVPLTARTTGEGERARTEVEGFLPPAAEVAVRWTEPRPSEELAVRLNADTYQLLTIQEGVLRSRVVMRYQVLRGKAKELSIELPEGVVLFRVAGDAIEDWRTYAATPDTPRQVRVTLGREMEGAYALELELETVISREEGHPLDLPIVRPIGVFRETGAIALFDGEKVGFAPVEAAQYSRAGEDALPVDIRQTLTERVSQALKHIGPPGPVATRIAAAKAREVRFDASVQTLYHVKEGALVGFASIMVELKSGREDKLVLSLPAEVNVLDVTAPSLNRHETVELDPPVAGRKGLEIRLTRAVEGAIPIDIEFERLLEKETASLSLPDVRVLSADVEEGSFGVTADAGIEVQPGEARDLRQVAVNDLPNAVRLRSARDVLLGYRYARAPWGLVIDIRRHRTVETLKAVVDAVWLETAVLADGHMVTSALYQVTNEDRQFLRLEMPEGHRVWSVTAAGHPVKAVADDTGALAIPLPKGESLLVEVVYELPFAQPGVAATLALEAPHADLVVTGLQWLVHLPAAYQVRDVATALRDFPAESFTPHPARSVGDGLGVDLAATGETVRYLFRRAVLDPSESRLSVDFALLSLPDGLGYGLFALALVLLAGVAWGLARRQRLVGGRRLYFVAGIVLLIAKGYLWQLTLAEGVTAVTLLAAVAVLSFWLARPREGEGS